MDSMYIDSKFVTGVVSKLISRSIRNSVGCNVDISIQELSLRFDGNRMHIELSTNCEMATEDLKKLIAKAGL